MPFKMKPSRIITSTLLLASVAAAGACNDGLTDLNVDPNNPPTAEPEYLLARGITSSVGRALGANFHMTLTALWVQHFAKIQYPDEDLYELRDNTINTHFEEFYADPLKNFQELRMLAEERDEPNYLGAALTMKSWTFALMTDVWGDIPYSEGLQASPEGGVVQPKYDTQQAIYAGILADLTTASESFTPASEFEGDLIYGGSAEAWKLFANSLRLRYAMRLSEVDPTTARAEFTAALADGVFTSNADNADLVYSGIPDNNPIHENQRTRDDHAISKTMVDTLASLDDPRLSIYADLNSEGVYRGMPNAVEVRPGTLGEFSRIGSYFVQESTPAVLMSYAEVLFLQAEAAQRGWIPGDAAELYRSAIRANMQMYGIGNAEINAYLAQPQVTYNPATGLQQIALQKWIALFNNGPEAYAEWRRTDYPNLVAGPDGANDGLIPVRVPYPSAEQAVNGANLQEAITRNGGDDLNDPVWWDK